MQCYNFGYRIDAARLLSRSMSSSNKLSLFSSKRFGAEKAIAKKSSRAEKTQALIEKLQSSDNVFTPRNHFSRCVYHHIKTLDSNEADFEKEKVKENKQKSKKLDIEAGEEERTKYRMRSSAGDALHEATEVFITKLCCYGLNLSLHARRKTIKVQDILIAAHLKEYLLPLYGVLHQWEPLKAGHVPIGPVNYIPKSSITRIIRRGGATRISFTMDLQIRHLLNLFVKTMVHKAMNYTRHFGRVFITKEDMLSALDFYKFKILGSENDPGNFTHQDYERERRMLSEGNDSDDESGNETDDPGELPACRNVM